MNFVLIVILSVSLLALGIVAVYQHVQAKRVRAQKRAELSLLMLQAEKRENALDAAQAFDMFRSACRLAHEAGAFDIEMEALQGAARNAHAAGDPVVARRYAVIAHEISIMNGQR